MPVYKWSRTAASNATADPTIGWAEGQAPSTVNDSSRAEMAAVKMFVDDIAGAIVTGGSSTAYTVTSYSVFDTLAHMDGAMIAFTPHATNGATVTLNVDGLGAKPLRPAPSVELQSNVLILGTPYVALYNNSDEVWYLQNLGSNTYGIPLGAGMDYWGTTAPSSAFVFPYGQAISRTTYATLFTLFSTTYGVGDGSTTFNLPDLRGRVTAGKDDMGGSAASRLTSATMSADGTTLGATGGTETRAILQANLPDVDFTSSTNNVLSGVISSGLAAVNNGTGSVVGVVPPVIGTNYRTVTTPSGGSDTELNVMQPTIICNYILRII